MWPGLDPSGGLGFSLALTVLLGWLWGSFLNQLADRRPFRDPARPYPEPPPGLLRPARSVCFGCGAVIPWHDNVPVASWLWLRGRCRKCGEAIGARTLAVEIATPLLLALWQLQAFARGMGPPAFLWGCGVLSWLLVAGIVLAERRRFGWGLLGTGAVLMVAPVWMG